MTVSVTEIVIVYYYSLFSGDVSVTVMVMLAVMGTVAVTTRLHDGNVMFHWNNLSGLQVGFWPPDASRARTFTFFIKKATRVAKF